MSIWRLIARLFDREVRAAIERLDDPAAALDAAYRHQLDVLRDVRAAVADVLTARKRLELEAAALDRASDLHRADARAALAAGDEARARRALLRRDDVAQRADVVRAEAGELARRVGDLERAQEQLRARTDALRTERDVSAARQAASRAGATAHRALAGLGPDAEAIATLVRDARDRARNDDARAAALAHLSATSEPETADDAAAIERRLRAEGAGERIEAELEALRREALPGTAPRAIAPPG